MGRKKLRKGEKGRRANLVREDDVMKRIALPDMVEFRRLCILRGVYPREMPKEENSPFAAFHKKDIAMINNDPMTWWIREHDTWLKNAKRRLHRGEQYGMPEPKAPYAELIASRYPTPLDAIHELDDALTVVALFAQLSGSDLIPSERITKCRKLLAEFHYYVARTRSLNCGFISVRGFYYMATIKGEKVVWLVPHSFPIPKDSEVDYRVMLDFLELYEHLLGFLNARLFIEIGMKYPPVYDEQKWSEGFYIDSIVDVFPQAQEALAEQEPEGDLPEVNDEQRKKMREALAKAAAEGTEELVEEEDRGIFADFVFTIDHSVPRDPISFVVKCLGGQVEWNEESEDPKITHTVIDRRQRPDEPRFMKRMYIQPQWVFDSLNAKRALPLDVSDGSYAPGKELPPRLSPFFGQEEPREETIGDDEREMVAGADDSDAEIDEDIKRVALETEYAEGMAREVGGEAEAMTKQKLEEMKAEIKQKKKEERARLAAGTLTNKQKRLYDDLKAKEDSRKNRNKQLQESKDDFEVDDKAIAGEEEEEEEEEHE